LDADVGKFAGINRGGQKRRREEGNVFFHSWMLVES
jgi:hypothetical protein